MGIKFPKHIEVGSIIICIEAEGKDNFVEFPATLNGLDDSIKFLEGLRKIAFESDRLN